MKNKKFKYAATAIGFFILTFHIFFILIYCVPEIATNSKFRAVITRYVYPVFNQNWKLFAPDPPLESKELYYRVYIKDKGWSGWKNPGKSIILKHQANRFSYYGKLYYIYDNLQRSLEYADSYTNFYIKQDSVKEENQRIERDKRIMKTFEYSSAKKYFKKFAERDYANDKILKIEFCHVTIFPPPFKNRKDLDKKNTYHIIRFPLFTLKEFTKIEHK